MSTGYDLRDLVIHDKTFTGWCYKHVCLLRCSVFLAKLSLAFPLGRLPFSVYAQPNHDQNMSNDEDDQEDGEALGNIELLEALRNHSREHSIGVTFWVRGISLETDRPSQDDSATLHTQQVLLKPLEDLDSEFNVLQICNFTLGPRQIIFEFILAESSEDFHRTEFDVIKSTVVLPRLSETEKLEAFPWNVGNFEVSSHPLIVQGVVVFSTINFLPS